MASTDPEVKRSKDGFGLNYDGQETLVCMSIPLHNFLVRFLVFLLFVQ